MDTQQAKPLEWIVHLQGCHCVSIVSYYKFIFTLYTRRQINLYRMFLCQFLTDFDEMLQGLLSSHAATTVKFSSKNIM